MPWRAYASERITVLLADIVFVGRMECRRSAFGGMEYWSTGVMVYRSWFYASKNLDAFCSRLQKIGVGFSFFQYSISKLSRVMESPLPGGKPKPGPLGLDSLLDLTV